MLNSDDIREYKILVDEKITLFAIICPVLKFRRQFFFFLNKFSGTRISQGINRGCASLPPYFLLFGIICEQTF